MEERAPSHESCCKIKTTTCPCPVCGNAGRKVTALTLDQHVPQHPLASIGEDATFCLNPECEVIYCNPQDFVIKRGETLAPVTIKDPGDAVLVCYCFEHSRGDLRRDIVKTGTTDIPEEIRAQVKAGHCDCERKNPQGACCLGNVAGAIKKIQEEVKSHA